MTENKNAEINKKRDIAGIAAVLPVIFLCASPLIMLILDIIVPSFAERQYIVYPAMIRIISLISIVCMAAVMSYEMEGPGLHIDLKDVFFFLFALCMLISTAVNGISHDAIFSVPYRYVGVYDLLIYIFIYMYCAGRFVSEQHINACLAGLMAISDVIAAAFFYNHFTGKIAAFNDKLEPSAVFFHGNHYGYFLVTVIAISAGFYCFSKGRLAALGGLSCASGLAALAVNRSMGCILAAAITILIVFIISFLNEGSQRKKSFTMMISIIMIVALSVIVSSRLREDISETLREFTQIISGNNNIYAGNGRWGIWQYVAGYIADYPIWGYGCESIAEIMKDYTLTTSPHNEPLTYAVFFGLPAAGFYCAAVITAVIKGLKTKENDGICRIAALGATAYFISSLFGVAMFYTAPYLFVLIGIAACNRNHI